ncbi:hypothetical protein [Chthonomonas calidirosea]|uniref:hypothetical protein n=1 Tax=Chthonomonas calidirosea TaxID=454171 RepID=UPI0006EC664D|nr:hypothetical protein [Chthonomonas calidirosea]CEK13076.1 hypothetical protein CP488_00348 [Chthonomonas calidirosea]
MNRYRFQHKARFVALLLCLLIGILPACHAQMVEGEDMANFQQTFNVVPHQKNRFLSVVLLKMAGVDNVLTPDEQATFVVQIQNLTDQSLNTLCTPEIIGYGTYGVPGDIWLPHLYRISKTLQKPFTLTLAPKASATYTLQPDIPSRFGGYALVLDFGNYGRIFVTTCIRTFAHSSERIQYPHFCLDADIPATVLKRLGVHAVRFGVGYKPTTDKDWDEWYNNVAQQLKTFQQNDIAVLFMAGGGALYGPTQPLGRPRPWLNDQGVMLDTKFDIAWLPSYDADFQKWCYLFASQFGWPKGPINAFSLWNEPWEGISISGWGADMLRYRDIYWHMAQGILQARKDAGVQVLVGGCDSTSNAVDKLFCDGKDTFTNIFDFVSIHYQGLDSHATVKAWVNHKGPYGRVRIWDTESWVANTDDRVAAVVAGDRAAGYDRAMGVYHGNVCEVQDQYINTPDGKRQYVPNDEVWSTAAAVSAATHFIGERPFERLLFRPGLPWVMVFGGRPDSEGRSDPEDGTVVVVGDLGAEFGAYNLPFWTARGYAELQHKAQLRAQLAALPPNAPAAERQKLITALQTPEPLSGATMTLEAGPYSLYDFYGNPVPPQNGHIVVPLDGRGFFLRGNGEKGSFAALLKAIQHAYIQGFEPIATVAHDMTAPISQHPVMRLELTNLLNRPITGRLEVHLGQLHIAAPSTLSFNPNQTKEVDVRVIGGTPTADNTYPLHLVFDAGKDGKTVWEEPMHVNYIAYRTIKVDGDLSDWKGVLPQPLQSDNSNASSLTQQAWFPFKPLPQNVKKGFAVAYLAYDQHYFYFAARIADDTPEPGTLRFATRDDDPFFYPEVCYYPQKDASGKVKLVPLHWPQGVRRYSYRKDPILPAGNAPYFDNVQIAFNVLPQSLKPWYPYPKGTEFGFTTYKDTDYEYALNKVAPQYGGGTEIWRLEYPGMPHKHFYPRQPKSPYDGPVKNGKLVIKQVGNTRIVECAIPWSEIPWVKKRIDAGETIKFSYRVNDGGNPGCMELSRLRSVARINGSFHVDWVEHWANALEFGCQPAPKKATPPGARP